MDLNPYQSPVAIESGEPDSDHQSFLGWSGFWILALGINLPIPFLFASMAVEGTPWIGIWIGLLSLVASGVAAAKFQPKLLQLVSTGGLFTAGTQLFPVLHMIFGSIAIGVCAKLGLASNVDDTMTTIHGPLGGFVATIVTAVPFLVIAFACGFSFARLNKRPSTPEPQLRNERP